MCGIAGIVSSDPSLITSSRLRNMTDSIIHRGPEAESFWINGNVGFGHRRLCIIDLSIAAAQPMRYLDRYMIVYNGEIYNYLELKHTLKQQGYQFQSESDTEVVLAAYACYKEECLQYFDGMFAFAIWDEQEQKLFAARDRFGEKPFYYFQHNANDFVFASEIKALWTAGAPRDYDGTMLLNYLTLGWTEHPLDKTKTFYKNIFALPAAHYLSVCPGQTPQITKYWSLDTGVVATDTKAAIEQFTALFQQSVSRRLRSDVPVGTSLSGGLDSSSVIAIAEKMTSSQYSHRSFSAVFPGYIKDESAFIQLITNKYQLKNHSISPVAADLANDFHRFMYHHDQPVANTSAFAQYKVFELAKKHNVTVLLDGQGADETLAGYSKYINWFLLELWRTKTRDFSKEKNALSKNNIPFSWTIRNILAATMPSVAAEQLQQKALKQLQGSQEVSEAFKEAYLDKESLYKPVIRKLNDVLAFNCTNFGLGELLRYADTNAMAHSREVRLPFLSHELVSFLFSLPSQLKIHEGWTKWLLRKSIAPYLPPETTWRKDKVGFEPPEDVWMRDEKVQEMIQQSKQRLADLRILNTDPGQKKNQPPGSPATDNIHWRFMVAEALVK